MRASMSPSERGGRSRAKPRAALLMFSSLCLAPGPIAFVHCMRTRPARSARHSATSVSVCGSGPGRRTVARSERSQSQIKPGIAGHGQGCWDPVQSNPAKSNPIAGVCHGAWLLGQFPGCSGGCRAGGAEEAALGSSSRSRWCHHERCVALAHAYAGRTRAQKASEED